VFGATIGKFQKNSSFSSFTNVGTKLANFCCYDDKLQQYCLQKEVVKIVSQAKNPSTKRAVDQQL
jgi:hypothetical protein